MSFLLENYGFWIVATLIVAAVGFTVFLNDRKPRTLGVGLGAALLVLILGSILYFFVDTDRKSLARTIQILATEIENDNLPGVLEHISPTATKTRDLAEKGLAHFGATSAKFRVLEVAVNPQSRPRTAKVRFNATVYWYSNHDNPLNAVFAVSESNPQLQLLGFNVEFEKNDVGNWLVTDQCRITINNREFDPMRLP